MVFPPSERFLCSDHPVAEKAYNQLADIFTNAKKLDNSEFFLIEKPKILKMENPQAEKQISIDPLSMKESEKSCLPMTPNDSGMPPLPLPPRNSKFLSYSLPGSAASSPRFTKKSKNQVPNSLAHQPSLALSRLAQLRENHLRRSKSCGEGWDEFDLWFSRSSSFKTEPQKNRAEMEMDDSYDDKFKCGAMCLFLPSFGSKGKLPVRSRKEEREMKHVISRTVSLEKFECGSWSSAAFIYGNESDGESSKLFFDLPLELIQTSGNDADLPVKAAFVYEKDRKGVLNNGMSRGMGRKSHESSRHVRFSVSSSPASHPTPVSPCITPRLRKAREEFNAFLEAQSA